ncbi:MAG: haloacid dehalogenase, partial [Candidatus Woesearchaeota archaeon]
MFDKKSFRDMKKELEKCEHEIEKAIMHSRELTRESKLAIYSVHRGDINEAEKKLINVRRELKKIKTKNYLYSVSYQEYVEAECILAFAKNKKIPTHTLLGIDAENYLLGICDFTGELA